MSSLISIIIIIHLLTVMNFKIKFNNEIFCFSILDYLTREKKRTRLNLFKTQKQNQKMSEVESNTNGKVKINQMKSFHKT